MKLIANNVVKFLDFFSYQLGARTKIVLNSLFSINDNWLLEMAMNQLII